MPAVRVDRDPLARAGLAVALELARVHRLVEQPSAVEREADRARAVVARVLPVAVPAAVLVRLVRDAVRGSDGVLHLLRRVVWREGRAAVGRQRDLGAV